MLVIALRWWGAREELRKGSGRGLFLSPEKKYLYNFYAVPPLPEKISVPKIIILHFIIIVIIFLCILTQYSIVSHFEVGPRD